jgi:hypothetical protein
MIGVNEIEMKWLDKYNDMKKGKKIMRKNIK